MANNSPPNPGDASAAVNSPQAKAAGRATASPWTQVVRGVESESIVSSAAAAAIPTTPAMPSASVQGTINNFSPDRSPTKAAAAVAGSSSSSLSSSDGSAADPQLGHSDGGAANGNAGKKPVWNKPSNGAIEVVSVIDTGYWPALSESAKASPKAASSDSSLKAVPALPEGLVPAPAPAPQVTGIASPPMPKQAGTGNSNPTPSANNTISKGQRSTRRVGGSSSGNTNTNGRFPQPNPPISPVLELSSNSTARSGPAFQDSSSRDRVGSQSHSGSDQSQHQHQHQHQQRGSFRRGNGSSHPRGDGSHPRGDGSYHQNYGNRRDQDRGSHEWNSHQSFNGRDGNIQTPRASARGGMRPSQRGGSNNFISPPPMPIRPLVNPMVYPDIPPHFIYFPAPPDFRGMPIVAPMPPRGPAYIFPPPDLQLHTSIVKQIEYYFSNDNLVKDIYLRQNMDDQGWVPIKLIAGFRRVKELTDNFKLIMDAVCASSVVEVQGEKVRKRGDWSKWVMPSPGQFSTASSPRSFGRPGDDNLAANLEGVSLSETTNQKGRAEVLLGRSPTEGLYSSSSSSSKDHPSGGVGLG